MDKLKSSEELAEQLALMYAPKDRHLYRELLLAMVRQAKSEGKLEAVRTAMQRWPAEVEGSLH